ncbi:hypothetical protein [Lentzea sp. NBRC 102530]|uniref:hypothetical protein n=1 Tax=Lentzea sp. NBRC 102530 TaxID=3032201 RepID=UPI0024A028A9|nr:hypothetical protein [Lentzea sp. NBRC 102530]GLY51455.1 hypothetical protein Lesp01_51110 [Lentzea sp. NBRC 102530]
MAIGDARLLKLVHDLTSADSSRCEDAAGTVTDWLSSFSPREARVVGAVLASAAAVAGAGCRESLLHALFELSGRGHLGADEVAPVQDIPQDSLGPSEQEYLAGISEEHA